ncbi:LOW QUALITY PROTEIN: hypothetical protein SPRG_11804 [Saprolegnia parasitica CBS 223.65]|uniref:Uncharacterized protein n=1 Tax=Saprolegnia parasitica (strain CBS 223.65) TaxID=695850 RepID=A0A067C812_SAPPC|nr:LOW QUALITY PROTEIN: hypothetical protein SPRG_11804 [Saprolegnia parasitica CBS 223.65]KDO22957.1 LOW QUALITY PROTEIN: hypothetical protein SPRG_11804 [Saprolegnia parasitica CBS 223.65]|eukprot:XP_012206249.1 LOW QUALITY PROTEIN: hypothetical protein SPRG_11804 [Saprolegnia parasitica CBS 223.65]
MPTTRASDEKRNDLEILEQRHCSCEAACVVTGPSRSWRARLVVGERGLAFAGCFVPRSMARKSWCALCPRKAHLDHLQLERPSTIQSTEIASARPAPYKAHHRLPVRGRVRVTSASCLLVDCHAAAGVRPTR